MPPRNWKIRIKDILTAIERNQQYTSGMSAAQFYKDQKTIDAVVRNFTVIGEASARIPESVRTKNPSLPWADMISMRNFVVHEYFGVSNDVLWNTIQQDLPQLVPHLKALLGE